MQIALTIRAKVVPRIHGRSALRAVIWQRLAHQEINDEANRKISRPKYDHQKRP
jgi:hypothetical protein